jgi:hypothetical protein
LEEQPRWKRSVVVLAPTFILEVPDKVNFTIVYIKEMLRTAFNLKDKGWKWIKDKQNVK